MQPNFKIYLEEYEQLKASGIEPQEAQERIKAKIKLEKNNLKSAAEYLKDFINGIDESINTPCISTGFNNLDLALNGGLYEGLYILGAISSLGKTSLLLQIADQAASQGQDVLIFSLEMARSELMAKSISRGTWKGTKEKYRAKTTREILNGQLYSTYSSLDKENINKAIDNYSHFANNIYIHEGLGDIGVEDIKSLVQQHILITGNNPIVIIDYLQILAPYNIRATDKQNIDKAVLELKRLSRDYKLPVIAISSFNRDTYKEGGQNKGKATMNSFKESGAIEYSADVLLGLEFKAAGSTDYDETLERMKNPREVRTVVLKDRNGETRKEACFKYYAAYNYFEEENAAGLPDQEGRRKLFDEMKKK